MIRRTLSEIVNSARIGAPATGEELSELLLTDSKSTDYKELNQRADELLGFFSDNVHPMSAVYVLGRALSQLGLALAREAGESEVVGIGAIAAPSLFADLSERQALEACAQQFDVLQKVYEDLKSDSALQEITDLLGSIVSAGARPTSPSVKA